MGIALGIVTVETDIFVKRRTRLKYIASGTTHQKSKSMTPIFISQVSEVGNIAKETIRER